MALILIAYVGKRLGIDVNSIKACNKDQHEKLDKLIV